MSVHSLETPTQHVELLSRQQWDEMVDLHINTAEATSDTNLGVVFIDINFFKRVNDEIGHDKGDEVIAAVGELITNVSAQFRTQNNTDRRPDVISHEHIEDAQPAKWGGDEFAVLTHADENGVRDFVDRIRTTFNEYIEQPEQEELRNLGVGIAIGAAMFELGKTSEDLVAEASEAMKEDKKRQLPELTPHEREVSKKIQELLNEVDNPDILIRHLVQR